MSVSMLCVFCREKFEVKDNKGLSIVNILFFIFDLRFKSLLLKLLLLDVVILLVRKWVCWKWINKDRVVVRVLDKN